MISDPTTLLRALNGIGLPFSEEMWRNVGDDGPENGRASVEWRAAHREVVKFAKTVHATDQRIRRLEAALRVARGYVMHDGSPQAGRDLVTLDAALAIGRSAPDEGADRQQEDLRAVLERIAYMRPAGDINAARNLRPLVKAIETEAMNALARTEIR